MPSKSTKRLFLFTPHLNGEELTCIQQRAFESNFIAPLGLMVDAFEQEIAEMADMPFAMTLSGRKVGTYSLREMLAGKFAGFGITVNSARPTTEQTDLIRLDPVCVPEEDRAPP